MLCPQRCFMLWIDDQKLKNISVHYCRFDPRIYFTYFVLCHLWLIECSSLSNLIILKLGYFCLYYTLFIILIYSNLVKRFIWRVIFCVFSDYLCPPEANVYGIDFTRFKLRDMDSGSVIFEVAKPPPAGNSGWTMYVIHLGIFFIENFIMAEIFESSDKIKLIFILF